MMTETYDEWFDRTFNDYIIDEKDWAQHPWSKLCGLFCSHPDYKKKMEEFHEYFSIDKNDQWMYDDYVGDIWNAAIYAVFNITCDFEKRRIHLEFDYHNGTFDVYKNMSLEEFQRKYPKWETAPRQIGLFKAWRRANASA